MHAENNSPDGNLFFRTVKIITDLIEKPVIWFRETVVLPNRQEYAWYHEQIRRVPTVDECSNDDLVCIFEANEQYKRDRMVDDHILTILRRRVENCTVYNTPDDVGVCDPVRRDWLKAQTNFLIKYGDMRAAGYAKEAYMKQKHRMIWERRHGPIGGKARAESDDIIHTCEGL